MLPFLSQAPTSMLPVGCVGTITRTPRTMRCAQTAKWPAPCWIWGTAGESITPSGSALRAAWTTAASATRGWRRSILAPSTAASSIKLAGLCGNVAPSWTRRRLSTAVFTTCAASEITAQEGSAKPSRLTPWSAKRLASPSETGECRQDVVSAQAGKLGREAGRQWAGREALR